MLIGYEANNAMRNSGELGDYCRTLIERLSSRHIRDGYHALLFSTRMKSDWQDYFSGCSNVSTYLPVGGARLLPEAWMRYRLNPWLKSEKVKLFHGLNEELPYHISRDIKTVITYYGEGHHHGSSLLDMLLWKMRVRYAFGAADAIIAVSDEVRNQLIEQGVNSDKIVVIGTPGRPFEVTDEVVDAHFRLYKSLLGDEAENSLI